MHGLIKDRGLSAFMVSMCGIIVGIVYFLATTSGCLYHFPAQRTTAKPTTTKAATTATTTSPVSNNLDRNERPYHQIGYRNNPPR